MNQLTPLVPHLARLLLLAATLLPTLGCGGAAKGPKRYRLSGTATYDGRPIPVGFITLAPDTSAGNSGPGGGAEIKDGKFETAPGKGTVGGSHVVTIVGYDGKPVSMEGEQLPDGQSLFTPYQTTVDFPRADSTQDFVIPKK